KRKEVASMDHRQRGYSRELEEDQDHQYRRRGPHHSRGTDAPRPAEQEEAPRQATYNKSPAIHLTSFQLQPGYVARGGFASSERTSSRGHVEPSCLCSRSVRWPG